MRFVENIHPDETVDLVYRMCPMHLLEPEERLREMKPGEILEIVTDYDQALDDIPALCERTGNEFIGVEEEAAGDVFKIYVRKLH